MDLKEGRYYKGCILEDNGNYWDSVSFKVDGIYSKEGVTMVNLLVKLSESILNGIVTSKLTSVIASIDNIDIITQVVPEEFQEGLKE